MVDARCTGKEKVLHALLGKAFLAFMKKFAVPVAVAHPLDHFDPVVDALQLTRVHGPAHPTQNASPVVRCGWKRRLPAIFARGTVDVRRTSSSRSGNIPNTPRHSAEFTPIFGSHPV